MAVLEEIVEDGPVTGLVNTVDPSEVKSTSKRRAKELIQKAKERVSKMIRRIKALIQRKDQDIIASSTSTTPRGEFTLFANLPAELRIKIWNFTFTPRTLSTHLKYDIPGQVAANCENFRNGLRPLPQIHYLKRSWQPMTLPAAFSICRESRYEALQAYPILFGTPNPQARGPGSPGFPNAYSYVGSRKVVTGVPIYFNADLDTLELSNPHPLDFIPPPLSEEREELEIMAAETEDSILKVKSYRTNMETIFSNLLAQAGQGDSLQEATRYLLQLRGLERLDIVIRHRFQRGQMLDLIVRKFNDETLLSEIEAAYSLGPFTFPRILLRLGRKTIGDVKAAILEVFKRQRVGDDRWGGEAGVVVDLVFQPGGSREDQRWQ